MRKRTDKERIYHSGLACEYQKPDTCNQHVNLDAAHVLGYPLKKAPLPGDGRIPSGHAVFTA